MSLTHRRTVPSFVIMLIVGSLSTIGQSAWAACDTTTPSRTPTSRYLVNGGEAYDKTTDLTWSRCSVGQRWREGAGCVGTVRTMSWSDAMKMASGKWRIPTKDELWSLDSRTCKSPTINQEVFPGLDFHSLIYWTSTDYIHPSGVGARGDYVVDFGVAPDAYPDPIGHRYAVRLVRGGR